MVLRKAVKPLRKKIPLGCRLFTCSLEHEQLGLDAIETHVVFAARTGLYSAYLSVLFLQPFQIDEV